MFIVIMNRKYSLLSDLFLRFVIRTDCTVLIFHSILYVLNEMLNYI